MESIVFILAHVVLCSGFVTKPVLIKHQYFGYCWAVLTYGQRFLFFPPYLIERKLGVHKVLGRLTTRTAYMDSQRNILMSRTMWCLAQEKTQGKDQEGEVFVVMVFVFPNNLYTCFCGSISSSGTICILTFNDIFKDFI